MIIDAVREGKGKLSLLTIFSEIQYLTKVRIYVCVSVCLCFCVCV